MSRDAPDVPAGRLVALTWEIPTNFGGLTKAMLQRSHVLHDTTGRPVEILTLAHQPDLDEHRADLVVRGLLSPGVSITNLWEDLATLDDQTLASMGGDPPAATRPVPVTGETIDEVHRPDGSLLGRQVWVRETEDTPLSPWGDRVRSTELFAVDGRAIGSWSGSWPLWHAWLEHHLSPGPAHVIVDSSYVADCLATAPLSVPTTWVVHNSHLQAGRKGDYGPVQPWRAYAVPRSAAFDAVVYLTGTQRDAAERLLGPLGAGDRARVVPNLLPPSGPLARARRPARQGIAMGSFEKRKRVDHAVRAVTAAAVGAPGVRLRVFGTGPLHDDLVRLVDDTQAPVDVVGHTTSPAERFAESSFMLLTSTREGFGMVLTESMAAGCVPIAYDIPFGPADIITDGVDGYLVEAGDVDAMAARIVSFVQAPWWKRRRVRRAARRRAGDFAPAEVAGRWAAAMVAADDHRARRRDAPVSQSTFTDAEHAALDLRLHPPILAVVATHAVFNGNTLRLRVDATLDTDRFTGPLGLDVQVVHAPDGSRAVASAVRSTPVTSGNRHGCVEVEIDTDQLLEGPGAPATLDHVLLVTAQVGHVTLLDTITSSDVDLPLAPASSTRPLALLQKGQGIRLVTATPSVAGVVRPGPDGTLEVQVRSLVGGDVQHVDAIDTAGPSTVRAVQVGGGWSLDLPAGRSWSVRATVAGTARDLAWDGAGPPPPLPAVQVRLTPRGYVRLAT